MALKTWGLNFEDIASFFIAEENISKSRKKNIIGALSPKKNGEKKQSEF